MRNIFAIILFVFVAACSAINGSGETRPTLPPFMPGPPQGGPPEFQEGWKDGCETGIGAHGNDVYRSSFKFKQNPSLVMNPIYYKAWKDGENYCRTYIFAYSFRNLDVSCTLDGIVDDCGGPEENNLPFFGQSVNNTGYNFLGGGTGDFGSAMGGAGGDAPGMSGNEDAISGVMGGW